MISNRNLPDITPCSKLVPLLQCFHAERHHPLYQDEQKKCAVLLENLLAMSLAWNSGGIGLCSYQSVLLVENLLAGMPKLLWALDC